MENFEESWIMLDKEIIYFYIKRKKIKNMYMKFTDDGKLLITTSKTCSLERIENFIKSKQDWIFKQIRLQESIIKEKESINLSDNNNAYFLGKKYKIKIISGKKNEVYIKDENIILIVKEKFIENSAYIQKVYEEWLKKECFRVSNIYVQLYYERMKKYKIPFPDIEIKKFKSRWGCCIPKKSKVEFAMNLIKTPKECIEYVVVHELAHFKYIHHNKDFYNFVSIFIPDWKERRKYLNKDFGRVIV